MLTESNGPHATKRNRQSSRTNIVCKMKIWQQKWAVTGKSGNSFMELGAGRSVLSWAAKRPEGRPWWFRSSTDFLLPREPISVSLGAPVDQYNLEVDVVLPEAHREGIFPFSSVLQSVL